LQRNLEVCDVSTGELSLYPAYMLQRASTLALVDTRRGAPDFENLVKAAEVVLSKASISIDASVIVEEHGLNIWASLWNICVPKVSDKEFLSVWEDWHLSLQRTWDFRRERDVLGHVAAVEQDALQADIHYWAEQRPDFPISGKWVKESDLPETLSGRWTCQTCQFQDNAIGSSTCKGCTKRTKGWKCGCCATSNKVISYSFGDFHFF